MDGEIIVTYQVLEEAADKLKSCAANCQSAGLDCSFNKSKGATVQALQSSRDSLLIMGNGVSNLMLHLSDVLKETAKQFQKADEGLQY